MGIMDSAKFGNIKQMINMKLSKGEDIDYESVKKDILNQAAELAIEEESRRIQLILRSIKQNIEKVSTAHVNVDDVGTITLTQRTNAFT